MKQIRVKKNILYVTSGLSSIDMLLLIWLKKALIEWLFTLAK
jgi:hypothetical protein